MIFQQLQERFAVIAITLGYVPMLIEHPHNRGLVLTKHEPT